MRGFLQTIVLIWQDSIWKNLIFYSDRTEYNRLHSFGGIIFGIVVGDYRLKTPRDEESLEWSTEAFKILNCTNRSRTTPHFFLGSTPIIIIIMK